MITRLCMALLVALISLPFSTWAATEMAHVYICAHPDDCVLFMNSNLYKDISSGTDKTLIVYLTSGEDGKAWHHNETSYPYVREQASLLATEWMGAIEHATPLVPHKAEQVRVHGHLVRRVRSAQVVSYFLRLPDGNMYGDGFPRYGHQSLQKLKEGAIDTIQAIDGTSDYKGWQDLVETIGTLVEKEIDSQTNIAFHFPNTDTLANHDDHSDHQHGAQAISQWLQQAPQAGRCYHIYQHLDYAIADLPQNLDAIAQRNSAGSFAVLTALQQQKMGYHHWNEAHMRYLGRDYKTYHTMPSGCDR